MTRFTGCTAFIVSCYKTPVTSVIALQLPLGLCSGKWYREFQERKPRGSVVGHPHNVVSDAECWHYTAS
jgi:hypothetical protein